jgi:hypothetical protein
MTRERKKRGKPVIPPTPPGVTIQATVHFTVGELSRAMTPNQIRAFLGGIGELVKAAKNLGTGSGTSRESDFSASASSERGKG